MLTLCNRRLATRSYINSYYSSDHHYPLSLPHLDSLPILSNRPQNNGRQPDHKEISDQEWEIRTGRAIYILRQTLPTFFTTGLIGTGNGSSSNSIKHIYGVDFGINIEPIYCPKVRLRYHPPVDLKVGWLGGVGVDGLPLYSASAVFVRHTLNALYSDLEVDLRRITVDTSSSSSPPSSPRTTNEDDGGKKRHRREKSLLVGLKVIGKSRVSGSLGEWEVNSTYTFNPYSGLIHLHTINSIQPAPHQAVFDALRAMFGRMSEGSEVGAPQPATHGAVCGEGEGTRNQK